MEHGGYWALQQHWLPDSLPGESEDAASPPSGLSASASSSSASSSPPSPLPMSPAHSLPSEFSSSSSASASAVSSSSFARAPLPQRRGNAVLDRRRQSKPARSHKHRLPKPSSEPIMFTMKDMPTEVTGEQKIVSGETATSDSVYRRCMTQATFDRIHGWPSQAAPDLLQLFSIFQFNKPEKPPARMLINVTLVGNIQPVRLLVAYSASVQDVISASLKAYAEEGRLPEKISKVHNYGLHYSPFCLESIDPTEQISTLGTRNFFLFPSSSQLSNTPEKSDEMKPWWNIFGSLRS